MYTNIVCICVMPLTSCQSSVLSMYFPILPDLSICVHVDFKVSHQEPPPGSPRPFFSISTKHYLCRLYRVCLVSLSFQFFHLPHSFSFYLLFSRPWKIKHLEYERLIALLWNKSLETSYFFNSSLLQNSSYNAYEGFIHKKFFYWSFLHFKSYRTVLYNFLSIFEIK